MSLAELKQNILTGNYEDTIGKRYLDIDIAEIETEIEITLDKAGKAYQTLADMQAELKDTFTIIEEGIEAFEYSDAIAEALKKLEDKIEVFGAQVDIVNSLYDSIEGIG